jgi:dolichol-phosphate mannosyltransferase
MNSSNGPLIAIATYNEMENLPRLVEELFQHVPAAHVLVVDDNSPDGTGRWCEKESIRNSQLRCIHRPAKSGLGTATVTAMKYAIQNGYEYLVMMDADFSHDPKYVPVLLNGMSPEGKPPLDVVIGSRYIPGGSTEGWGVKRRLMSRSVNLFARCLLGLSPKDCSGAFRCFRVQTLERLDFAQIKSRGYSFQEEILYRLNRLGARFGEVPIHFRDRQRGQSKINVSEAVAALRIISRLGVQARLGI